MDYWGNDLCTKNTCEKKETPEECQELCQNTEDCVEFTWVGPNANDWVKGRKMCWLKNQTSPNPTSSEHRVSGPKYCGKRVLILFMYNAKCFVTRL